MQVAIHVELCQGHGRCYTSAPDLFDPMDDFGRATVVGDGIVVEGSDRAVLARRALEGCPERAIYVQ